MKNKARILLEGKFWQLRKEKEKQKDGKQKI